MTDILIMVVPADINEPCVMRAIERGDIDAMQSIVGGLFDVARGEGPGGEAISVWVNDEGLLMGLPLNERASVIAGRGAHLVGDAFVTGGVDDEGNTLDIPLLTAMAITGAERKCGREVIAR